MPSVGILISGINLEDRYFEALTLKIAYEKAF